MPIVCPTLSMNIWESQQMCTMLLPSDLYVHLLCHQTEMDILMKNKRQPENDAIQVLDRPAETKSLENMMKDEMLSLTSICCES